MESRIKPGSYYVRQQSLAFTSSGHAVVVGTKARVAIEGVDGTRLSRLLERLALPVSGEELTKLIAPDREALEPGIAKLLERELVIEGTREELEKTLPKMAASDARPLFKKVVLGITGAIGAANMFETAMGLIQGRACESIDVILTPCALRFTTRTPFEAFGMRTWTDAFDVNTRDRAPHGTLAEMADLLLVAPASAHALHRLAQGACSDLLSLTAAMTEAPLVVVPSMNGRMWEKPAVQRNLELLRQDGAYVIEPYLGPEAVRFGRSKELTFGGSGVFRHSPLDMSRMLLEIRALHDHLKPGS